MLKSTGYKTGAFGKWRLGFIGSEGDAVKQRFDRFYIYNCQRMGHRYDPPYLWDNQEKGFLEGNDWTRTVTYAPDVVQERTPQFIEENKEQPFFAYVPLIHHHAELIAADDSVLAKLMGRFEEPKDLSKQLAYSSSYGPNMIAQKYCFQKGRTTSCANRK